MRAELVCVLLVSCGGSVDAGPVSVDAGDEQRACVSVDAGGPDFSAVCHPFGFMCDCTSGGGCCPGNTLCGHDERQDPWKACPVGMCCSLDGPAPVPQRYP